MICKKSSGQNVNKKHELPKSKIYIASNNGDIGGGEIMLLALARQLVSVNVSVTVLGPSNPPALVQASLQAGLKTISIESNSRVKYMRGLRRWRSENPSALLWCNGLLPSVATSGLTNRLVHLHQIPSNRLRILFWLARWRARVVLVPSSTMGKAIKRTRVFENWVEQITPTRVEKTKEHFRVGFLGRLSPDKGVGVLANALELLDNRNPGLYRVSLAGEPRFVDRRGQKSIKDSLDSIRHLTEFLGWMDPAAFFSEIDVLVIPSIWPESFGLVAAEALSAGIPLIVSDAGALPEVVGPTHPWIVPSGNVSLLADSIELVATTARMTDPDGSLPEVIASGWERWNDNYSPLAGQRRLRLLLKDLGIPTNVNKSNMEI